MTVNELIEKLEAIRWRHGGDDLVIVTGLYASSTTDIEVHRRRDDKSSAVYLETNLCTG